MKAISVERGEAYCLNCPFCQDRRGRLTVNHFFGVPDARTGSKNFRSWYCFNEKCHEYGRNRDDFRERLLFAGYRTGRVSTPELQSPGLTKQELAQLPEGTTPLHHLPNSHQACRYVSGRGFDPLELSTRWGVGYCPDSLNTKPSFEDRLIIPVHTINADNVDLVGWQARSIGPLEFGQRKYLFADGLKTSHLLYGLHQARSMTGPVIIVEGVTDAWRVGPGALAIFGKSERLSRQQVNLLNTHFPDRPIVVLLDRGAEYEAKGICRQLRRVRNEPVVIAKLPARYDDPGETPREVIHACVAAALGDPNYMNDIDGNIDILHDRTGLSSLGCQRLGATVGLAYNLHRDLNDPLCKHVDGIALVGEDSRLCYFCGGVSRVIESISDRRFIYQGALRTRLSIARAGLPSPQDFDCLRTVLRLLGENEPDLKDDANPLLQVAHSVMDPDARAALVSAASVRSVWNAGTLQKQLVEQGLDFLYREIELPAIDATVAMMRAGIGVGMEVLQDHLQRHTCQRDDLRAHINTLAGREVAVNDPHDLADVLCRLGIKRTLGACDDDPVDKYALRALAKQHEIARLILEYRHENSLATATGAVMENIDPHRGRVYCNLDPLGADTGRFTCDSPNLQGIPRELRDVFVADYGHRLIEADFSQVELRVLAHFSQDPQLVQAFRDGADIHRRTAGLIFQVHEADVTTRQRNVGKRINFGIVFGQTPYGLAKELRISELEAGEFIDAFLDAYQGVRCWIQNTQQQATQDGFVRTLYGRRRQLSDINSADKFKREHTLRQAVNTVIQGTAADINKLALIRLRAMLPAECRLLLTLHDSVLLEVHETIINDVAQFVKQSMEVQPPRFDVPLVVDVKSGPSRGNMDGA